MITTTACTPAAVRRIGARGTAAATAPLDPAGQGWTLHQLCLAGQDRTAAATRRG
jgi:hypothetical protein